ncbi:uncharacterized protein LOC131656459 [Vicia villosa]|uniref:uncharacterized protein LOC131656459 n=1 Tax=Vicia villosa TaxID=3911 RepID=UPI00273C3F89|nr:uncharacterized protein LOC131656459 [Vicia villosa]
MDELEVLCEMMVDFDNLQKHNLHLKNNMLLQGWEPFFNRLIGVVYPELVKEFWFHAMLLPKAIISFVCGQEISITENLIRRLIGLEGCEGASGAIIGRTDWDVVYAEIFKSGKGSTRIKDLKNPYRIWAKILLGCIYHRKATVSPNYINQDQQYILYCIGQGEKVDLPYILFIHVWNHVRDSREQARLKTPKIRRNIIPFGRLISDILVETGLIDDLVNAGIVKDLYATCGSTINAHTLKKMKLIETITATPRVVNEILTRRVLALADFEMFFKNDHPSIVLYYLEKCQKEGSEYDPVWKNKKKSSGISITESVPIPILNSEHISTESPPEKSPEIHPQTTKTSKSPSSASSKSKGKQPILDSEPILDPKPLNTIFQDENIFTSAKPPPSETQPQPYDPQPVVDTPVFCNFNLPSSPSSFSSDSFFRNPRPFKPTPQNPSSPLVVVVLDFDNVVDNQIIPASVVPAIEENPVASSAGPLTSVLLETLKELQ